MSEAIKQWRTVLVEDQTLLRQVLAKSIQLSPEFELIGEAETGTEGKRLCLNLEPDLLVTDIDLPELDGVELTRVVKQALPELRILALTHLKDALTLNRLREVGVHGYVEKDQSLEILEEAMTEVASGRDYFTATMCRTIEQVNADPNSFAKLLGQREQQVLCLVAQGFKSREIAERLALSPRSVETYRYRIMKKLEITSLAGLIDFAFKNGLVVEERQSPQ